jgi:hypothetical protein
MNTTDLCTINDQQGLADIVGALIYLYGDDSETKAAEQIGVSQPTLNRLRRGAAEAITRATASALERAVKALGDSDPTYLEMAGDLKAAIVAPETHQYMAGYTQWCDERLSRWQERDGMTWKVGPFRQLEPVADVPPAMAIVRQEMRRMLWQRAHQDFPELFRRFRDEMVSKGVEEVRQEVAVMRVIEPLLEATQSAYIERSYSELTERERRDFIDAGIKRELILLDREPAMTRARRITEEGADVFAKEQGGRALYVKERTPSPPPA